MWEKWSIPRSKPLRVYWIPQRLTHSYIYVYLDKAIIATFARLKAVSNVIKHWQKPSFRRRKKLPRWKHREDFSHVLGNQIPAHVSSFIRQQHDVRRFLEGNLDAFLFNQTREPQCLSNYCQLVPLTPSKKPWNALFWVTMCVCNF